MEALFAPLREAPPRPVFEPAFCGPEPPSPAQCAPPAAEDAGAALAGVRAEARAEGYAAGLEAGQRAAETLGQERIARAVEALTAALDRARAEAERVVEGAARDLASLLPTAVEAVLPGAAAQRAPDLLARLAETLRPSLLLVPSPRLAVAPGLAEVLAPPLAGLAITVVEDAAIPEGDARLAWDGGSLRFDRAARLAVLREALAQAGIKEE